MNKVLLVLAILILIQVGQSQEASRLFTLSETTSDKLLEIEGDTVRVKGFVESGNTNATGINFLVFKDSSFQCITFARYTRNFKDGLPVDLYAEKWIEVTGKMENYRGNPQIKLTDPKQVKIIKAPAPVVPEVKPSVAETEATEPDVEKKAEVVEPAASEEPEAETKVEDKGPKLEVVNGVEAVDWRLYFPSGKGK